MGGGWNDNISILEDDKGWWLIWRGTAFYRAKRNERKEWKTSRNEKSSSKRKMIWMNKFLLGVMMSYFLLSASIGFADFDVNWYIDKDGLTNRAYNVSIQNLLNVKQPFNLSILFSNTNFNLDDIYGVQLSEYKNLTYEYDVWVYDVSCQDIYENGTWNEVCTDNGHQETAIGYRCGWKPTKTAMFKKVDKLNSEYTLINIPKLESKPSDCTYNGTKWLRVEFNTPFIKLIDGWGSSGKIAFLDGLVEYHPAWNTSFAYCRNITIESDNIDADLNNYTILMRFNSSNINYTYTQDDGDDIRFVNTSCNNGGSEMAYEIEVWNESGNSDLWVKIPFINASEDTVVSVYYNYSDAESGEDVANAWDSNYVFVNHMQDTNTTHITDSINSIVGTKDGANEPIQTTPNIILAYNQYFPNNDDDIMHGDVATDGFATMSVEAWANITGDSPNGGATGIFNKDDRGQGSADASWNMLIADSDNTFKPRFWVSGDDDQASSTAIDYNVFNYLVGIYNGSHVVAYVNGYANGTVDTLSGTVLNAGASMDVCTVVDGSSNCNAGSQVAELRVSSVFRSNAWIKATYINTFTPYGFYDIAIDESTGTPTPPALDTIEEDLIVCFTIMPVCVNVAKETIYLTNQNNLVWLI